LSGSSRFGSVDVFKSSWRLIHSLLFRCSTSGAPPVAPRKKPVDPEQWRGTLHYLSVWIMKKITTSNSSHLISRLGLVEAVSAFALKVRDGQIQAGDFSAYRKRLLADVRNRTSTSFDSACSNSRTQTRTSAHA
jgi:hypothetical protein